MTAQTGTVPAGRVAARQQGSRCDQARPSKVSACQWRPTVACCWCWCGARLRLTPGPPPSPGHGAACRSDCGWCPPSAPARGKAPKHQASWQARRNSAAEVHQGGSCIPGSSAQQHAQGLCMWVQPQVCPRSA
ncbi:hypothetical protein OEZ86_011249 [Tetradesmus obliquus]|nr:hypothetical protein OEZ86_011249 [Tetradesmus obliquus]